MTNQAINIELPEDVYERLNGMATAMQRPVAEIISQTIRGNLPPVLKDLSLERRDLVADLQQMTDEALWTLAREPLPAGQWRRHQRLLGKAESSALTAKEHAELGELREETDRFVTRRSYALALLKWRGHTILSLP